MGGVAREKNMDNDRFCLADRSLVDSLSDDQVALLMALAEAADYVHAPPADYGDPKLFVEFLMEQACQRNLKSSSALLPEEMVRMGALDYALRNGQFESDTVSNSFIDDWEGFGDPFRQAVVDRIKKSFAEVESDGHYGVAGIQFDQERWQHVLDHAENFDSAEYASPTV
jgi:hypothetical protein